MTYDHVSISLPDGRSVVSLVVATDDGTPPTHRYRLVDGDGQVIKDFANLREIAAHIEPGNSDGAGAEGGPVSGTPVPW